MSLRGQGEHIWLIHFSLFFKKNNNNCEMVLFLSRRPLELLVDEWDCDINKLSIQAVCHCVAARLWLLSVLGDDCCCAEVILVVVVWVMWVGSCDAYESCLSWWFGLLLSSLFNVQVIAVVNICDSVSQIWVTYVSTLTAWVLVLL